MRCDEGWCHQPKTDVYKVFNVSKVYQGLMIFLSR